MTKVMTTELDAQRLIDHLVGEGALEAAAVERARRLAEETGERPDRVLFRLGLVGERTLAQALAATLNLPLATAADYPITPLGLAALSARFLREARAVPLAAGNGWLDVALADPLDQASVEAIGLASGCAVRRKVGVPAEVDAALGRLYGGEDGQGGLQALLAEAAPAQDSDVERLRDLASEAPIVRLVNQIIARAVDQRASDIHIEPFENDLRIRYRVDGRLAEQEAVPRRAAAAIVSRVKLMAGLDIAERRLPQDGRVKVAVRGKDIDFRVATSPTLYGESVVLRILDRNGVTLDFAALGFPPDILDVFLKQLERPNGIILVTGPTGSGKTTTLYAALERLNRPSRKIVTVEDPIEYQIHGINQIQVKPEIGLDFADILRSTLRHDPDIIMIGEIRDLETAQIAVQASLTGHLVLSTTHTNGAVATITRLIDLGVSDYLIASTLNAVLAQRLVRVLCPHCREPHAVPAELAAEIGLAALAGSARPTVFRAVGCPACLGTGYLGRTGLFEVLPVTDDLRERIVTHKGTTGMAAPGRTLFTDGLDKVVNGITSLEEVWAVAAER